MPKSIFRITIIVITILWVSIIVNYHSKYKSALSNYQAADSALENTIDALIMKTDQAKSRIKARDKANAIDRNTAREICKHTKAPRVYFLDWTCEVE